MIDRPSPNHERRRGTDAPDMVVLHYTGMTSARAAVDRLCHPRSGVSAHYLVDVDGAVVRMVDERRRAWHAGVAHWRGCSDVNSRSIGIEIHNPGHDFGYPPFPEAQVDAVIRLFDGMRARWTIPDARILAHADVAPTRKIDPGERFPWARLAAAGHGVWPTLRGAPAPGGPMPPVADAGSAAAGAEEPAAEPPPATDAEPPAAVDAGPIADVLAALRRTAEACAGAPAEPGLADWQRRLAAFGYEVAPTGRPDHATIAATSAFQRHFAPHRLDGRPDGPTRAALAAIAGSAP